MRNILSVDTHEATYSFKIACGSYSQ